MRIPDASRIGWEGSYETPKFIKEHFAHEKEVPYLLRKDLNYHQPIPTFPESKLETPEGEEEISSDKIKTEYEVLKDKLGYSPSTGSIEV